MTAARCADVVAGNVTHRLVDKEQIAAEIAAGVDCSSRLAGMISNARWWPESLLSAVRSGEVVSFTEASSGDDVDDILSRIGDDSRPAGLACIAGLASRAASDVAFAKPERIEVALALLASFAYARHWPTAKARIAKALGRIADDPTGSWQLATAWRSAARYGVTREAAELLRELGLHERALPLYEALLAFADNKTGELTHLAPEVRVPTEHYLAAFHAAVKNSAGDNPATPPASSRTKRKRVKAALTRAGKRDTRRRTPSS
jgi:hypothetical protein